VRRYRVALSILLAAVAVTAAPSAAAAPSQVPITITVEKAGNGSGTVTSSPAAIDCGAVCAASFPQGVLVRLTARPDLGSVFAGWNGGGCTGVGSCIVGTAASQTVVATFSAAGYALTVEVGGNGRVTTSPAGVACPQTCRYTFATGTQVRLTPDPAAGAEFIGWGGACSGTGGCVVAMTRAQTVTATFTATSVRAAVVSTRFRQNGRDGARRVLVVRVATEEPLTRIVARIRRGGATLASATSSDLDRGRSTVRVPVPDDAAPGAARLRVTFTGAAGAQESEVLAVRIPPRR
jgi:uncharacterized protein (DUF2141 family)